MVDPTPPQKPTREDAQAAAAADWAKRTEEWEALAKAQGVKLPPGATIDPKNVRVEIGPPMTEDEFKAWHRRRQNIAKNFSQ